jgi:hypothetical protein
MTTFNLLKNKKNYFSTEKSEIIELVSLGQGARRIFVVQRNGDKCKIKSVVFDIAQHLIGEDIDYKKEFNHGKITLDIGGQILSTIYFNILISISKIIRTKKSIIIEIPDYFFNEINMTALDFHEVKLITEFNNTRCELNSIYCEYKSLPYTERILSKLQTNTTDFQTFEHHIEPVNNQITRYRLCFNGYTKGYFIQGDIYKMEKICIQFNGHDKINYDENMILSFCEIIDDDLFYIPFDTEKNYNDLSFESYVGSHDHTMIDNIVIVIKLKNIDDIMDEIGIYGLRYICLKVKDGFGLPCNTPIDETYKIKKVQNLKNIREIDIQQNREYDKLRHVTLNSNASEEIYKDLWKTEELDLWKTEELDFDENEICILKNEPIENECAKCLICNNIFSYKETRKWLYLQHDYNKNCPICENEWTNNIKYVKNAQK